MKKIGFCIVCLGSNYPGQEDRPKDGWCCGSWVDRLFPPWGICGNFQVDREQVKKLSEHIRPDGTEKMACYGSTVIGKL